ncbi:MAG: glycerol-3-phosphate acyltransferase [Dehalococcoidales bacterium]|jgi:glycerol-3-phosphate acyltransferase PlsY|nr:glycerol-3-phosphate acyltransferase [Dehalococcoidales bacterium]
MIEFLAILTGYLLGSFPSSYVIGRLVKGIDIRQVGGGNAGALNTAREIGLVPGLIVLVIDIGKGALAVQLARIMGAGGIWIFAAGFAAVLGHIFPVYLKFRGGKGAATTLGVFLSLAPVALVCTLPVLIAIIAVTSNVTLGIASSMVLYPMFLWIFGSPIALIIESICLAVFVGLFYLPVALRSYRRMGRLKDFILERNYKPWQSKKK